MKFSLFTEIQCPAGSSPEMRLNEFLDQAELADQLGFRGFWIAEIHCQPRFSLLSVPYVVLGAVARRTRRLRLCNASQKSNIRHAAPARNGPENSDHPSHRTEPRQRKTAADPQIGSSP